VCIPISMYAVCCYQASFRPPYLAGLHGSVVTPLLSSSALPVALQPSAGTWVIGKGAVGKCQWVASKQSCRCLHNNPRFYGQPTRCCTLLCTSSVHVGWARALGQAPFEEVLRQEVLSKGRAPFNIMRAYTHGGLHRTVHFHCSSHDYYQFSIQAASIKAAVANQPQSVNELCAEGH